MTASSPLPATLCRRLITAARQTSRRAYAPFSKLKVGAAALTSSSHIFVGCNIENSSYGLTICAERVAVFNAVCSGYRSIRAIAVFAATPEPIPPCGACLQVIAGFGRNPELLLANRTRVERLRLSELLPRAFSFSR